MRRLLADMNPTLRGFLIILVITGVIAALWILARVAFFLAVAFFVFLAWRERRSEIGNWSTRSQLVFYGAALLIVGDLGVYFWRGASGPNAAAFLVVLGISGFAMWRVWRDEHHYVPPLR